MKLSVIIPTLNEALYLPLTLKKVRENHVSGEPHEIVVSDSGSADGSPEIAIRYGVRVVQSERFSPGRAKALNKGAASATGDVFFFLDADSIPPPGYDECIQKALENAAVVGGAFEFSLDGEGFGLRLVELMNRIRYRARKRFYGDQGIFVRSHAFTEIGGYPDMRILEAAHLCKNLSRAGELVLVKREVKTSPRRFVRGGVYSVLAEDVKIWFLDLMGISVDKYADRYWDENRLRTKD